MIIKIISGISRGFCQSALVKFGRVEVGPVREGFMLRSMTFSEKWFVCRIMRGILYYVRVVNFSQFLWPDSQLRSQFYRCYIGVILHCMP